MNTVKLEVLPWLTEALGARPSEHLLMEEEVADGATVGDLLTKLAQRYPRFQKVAFAPGSQMLRDEISVIVNDRILELLQGLETKLSNGDVIVLLPAFSGG